MVDCFLVLPFLGIMADPAFSGPFWLLQPLLPHFIVSPF
jgi:hypothetical protein